MGEGTPTSLPCEWNASKPAQMKALATSESIDEIGSDTSLPIVIYLVRTDRLGIKQIIFSNVELIKCRLDLVGGILRLLLEVPPTVLAYHKHRT